MLHYVPRQACSAQPFNFAYKQLAAAVSGGSKRGYWLQAVAFVSKII